MKFGLARVTVLLVALAVVAASCGDASDGTATPETSPPTTAEAAPATTAAESPATTAAESPATTAEAAPATTAAETTTTTQAPTEPAAGLPGEGVSVKMGRGNWSSGYFQAALMRELVALLGYEVTDPGDNELAPSLAFLAMAEGDLDFWANTWDPLHDNWFANELPDGSIVGDHVSKVGKLLEGGALQGFLVTKSFADEFGIATFDDLENNPDAIAAYDSDDSSPGDGVVDMFGCTESWTCDDTIDNMFAFSGFENIRQVKAGYDAMFAQARAKVDADEPVIIYTWTPTAYLAHLRPGDNVVWIGIEKVLDDSNPLGIEGGEALDQRPGVAAFEADSCPSAATLGECRIGFKVADVIVAGSNAFLDENPAAKKLLEIVQLNIVDVTVNILEHEQNEADPGDLARQWVNENQDQVDAWIAEAMAAA